VVHDADSDERTLAPEFGAAFDALQMKSAVAVSLLKDERLVAALYVHDKEPRRWTASQVLTIEEIAEATWSALERQVAEARLRRSEERYRRIFEQTSDLIITATLDQTITDCNPAAAEAVGVSRELAIGRSIAEFVSPEDFGQTTDMLRQKLQNRGTTRYDVRVRNSADEWLYWEINSGLTIGDDGKPLELHVVGRDVTERKRAEEQQRLLINELNHRVKNTLAIVQSIARQTLRGGGASADAQQALESRLATLAAAHDVLTRENWNPVSIREIVNNALAPFCSGERCDVEGPDLRLGPQTAVSLSLALHELATNASKYGALSANQGTVAVHWTREEGRFKLSWREIGGPPVNEPSRRGFGSRMIERAFASEVQGNASLRFEPAGVICEVDAPLTSFAS
jgi:PAS domain S-box-containing protein